MKNTIHLVPKPTLKRFVFFAIVLITLIALYGCASNHKTFLQDSKKRVRQSSQFYDGEFHNTIEVDLFSFRKMIDMMGESFSGEEAILVPTEEIPLMKMSPSVFPEKEVEAFYFARLGHSSLLLWINGKVWLTDPQFSQRASMVQWIGPKRFHPVPIKLEDIPEIEGVIISHDHYDHLDNGTIMALKDRVKHFFTPLGVGAIIADWGVDPDKIHEFDWWDSKTVGNFEVIATPAQHFSGRGLFSMGETLWASWVIRWNQSSVFFSGDTGYFDGFKEIGLRYGPFDVAFMENGAYNEKWRHIHMLPEDTIQAFKDLNGKLMVPIHNSTFNLSNHDWFDPMESITALARENGVNLLIPYIGQVIDISNPPNTIAWWRDLMPSDNKYQVVTK